MNNADPSNLLGHLNRRSFLRGAAGVCAVKAGLAWGQASPGSATDLSALKLAAQHAGKTLGMYTVQHELLFDPTAAATIANNFSLIADGNDLKFSNRLRPTPETYDFSFGDTAVNWAQQHKMLFRGHCLIWWNGLPSWFQSYVTPANAPQVLNDHVTNVVKHYKGRIFSWDVVNEPIHQETRADGLRRKPWVDLIGPQYIDMAFQAAYAADPKAKLVLNECYVEHNTPSEIWRRGMLLALATRLKKANVPITTIGLQSHLRGNTPIDHPGMTTFCKQIHDLGLDIMITELDVDDVDVPGPQIEQVVASKYGEYLDLMLPFVKVITFEQLHDDISLPKRADGLQHRPNLLDSNFQMTDAYSAALKAFKKAATSPTSAG